MDLRCILFVIIAGIAVGLQGIFLVKPLLLRAATYFTGTSPEFTVPLKVGVVLLSLVVGFIEAILVMRLQGRRPNR